ncbi:MAG: Cof-type HAD-IIB family hydrolase, partial [Alicyclobacillaceae bacterium]|nr:Cof-type HAD-IIB family hydrolase [Alicyclobacillaceae bacterium]
VKRAVVLLREQGVRIGIATGRSYAHTREVMKELGIEIAVLNNGGLAVCRERVVSHRPIPAEQVERLLEDVEQYGHGIVLHGKDFTVVKKPEDPYFLEAYAYLRVPFPELFQGPYRGEPVYQCNLFCPEEEISRYADTYPDLAFRWWYRGSHDVNPIGVHKAEGIASVLQEWKISWDEVIAFGDADNDVQMLRAAGLGVALSGGLQVAREAADVVIGRPEDDAIWHFVSGELLQMTP